MVIRDEVIGNHYQKNYTKLVKLTQRRVPNNSVALAEEVVQEAYSRALKYFSTFDNKINAFDTWFGAILRNATNDCRASEKGNPLPYDDNLEDLTISREDHIILQNSVVDIYKTYNTNKRDYIILSMFFINGYTSKDISIYTGVNHSNVRQIIFKFKNKLNEVNN